MVSHFCENIHYVDFCLPDHTLQLLDKYKESESANQQGGWEKIKKCFKRG